MRASEFTPTNQLVIFDIDDTLFHTTAKILVRDKETGETIRSLTNQEFNDYKLKPNEVYDFGEFRNAEKFEEESIPIGPMLDQLRQDLRAGHRVVMLTAREDFDNQKTIWRTFKRHGIDINRDVHLYRAGNLPGSESPAEKKAKFVRLWLNKHLYDSVTLYDDSTTNLRVFKALQKEYPTVKFVAHHVTQGGKTKKIEGVDFTAPRGVANPIGSDNVISPVGSVPTNQRINKKKA